MNTFIQWAKWSGTAASCLGAVLLALKLDMLGYLCMLAGSIAWLFAGVADRDKPTYTQWGFFFVCNVVGIYTRI